MSAAALSAESTRYGIPSRSRRLGVIRPVRMCSGASFPSYPRHVTTTSAGSPYIIDSDANALRLVPSPEFCMSTHGRRPANHAPAAMPTAASSRTAAMYGAARCASSIAMTSSTSEHGTPVKKSNPWRVSSVATSRPAIIAGLAEPDAAAAHDAQELAERGEPHEGIGSLFLADARRRTAVVVTGKQERVVRKRAESSRERVV